MKYTGSYLEEYGIEDELTASEEPFEASFTRLMDITKVITADEEQPQVCVCACVCVCVVHACVCVCHHSR